MKEGTSKTCEIRNMCYMCVKCVTCATCGINTVSNVWKRELAKYMKWEKNILKEH